MGRITDEKKAYNRRVGCHGFVLAPDKTIADVVSEIRRTGKVPGKDVFLFKEGILGALSDEQDEDSRICDPKLLVLEPTPPKLAYRWELMRGLREGKLACIEDIDRRRAILYLRKRAAETPDKEEREVLNEVIKDILDIPVCPE